MHLIGVSILSAIVKPPQTSAIILNPNDNRTCSVISNLYDISSLEGGPAYDAEIARFKQHFGHPLHNAATYVAPNQR